MIWGNGVGYNIFVVCENAQSLRLTGIALICEYLNKTDKTPFSNSQICHRKYTAQNTNKPLVLHGGSGVPDSSVRKAISLGMAKVNFATELRAAATAGVRRVLEDDTVIDPKKYMGAAKEEVKKMCRTKIEMCGSKNKA